MDTNEITALMVLDGKTEFISVTLAKLAGITLREAAEILASMARAKVLRVDRWEGPFPVYQWMPVAETEKDYSAYDQNSSKLNQNK